MNRSHPVSNTENEWLAVFKVTVKVQTVSDSLSGPYLLNDLTAACQKNDWQSGRPPVCQTDAKPSCPHPDNKAHFVRSLSLPPLIQQTPVDKTIVAGDGFSDATQTESPNPDKDVSFVASYEEADTKTFLSLICF